MKNSGLLFKISCIALISGLSFLACQKDEPVANTPPNNNDTSTVASLDTLTNHFIFLGADKIAGNIPAVTTGGASLKFSIKDTIYLAKGVYAPIKFLHDTSNNITGIFLQVIGLNGGSLSASNYFDVPEIPDLDDDTVSVVLVRFDPNTDPSDFDLPLSFNIKIEPHNDKGQPLDVVTIPVKVEKSNNDPYGSICGLTGGYWEWEYSIIIPASNDARDITFFNNPDKVWGRIGQLINGSCCEGTSVYGNCPGVLLPNRSLHFSTYSQYVEENITMYENNTFGRTTIQNYATPFPDESDFCSNNGGVVHNKITEVSYEGNLIFNQVSVPERLLDYFDGNICTQLVLNQTSSSNFGYGNPGGLIKELECTYLVLVQLDPEGYNQDLTKYYKRKSNYQGDDEDDWYDIPED